MAEPISSGISQDTFIPLRSSFPSPEIPPPLFTIPYSGSPEQISPEKHETFIENMYRKL